MKEPTAVCVSARGRCKATLNPLSIVAANCCLRRGRLGGSRSRTLESLPLPPGSARWFEQLAATFRKPSASAGLGPVVRAIGSYIPKALRFRRARPGGSSNWQLHSESPPLPPGSARWREQLAATSQHSKNSLSVRLVRAGAAFTAFSPAPPPRATSHHPTRPLLLHQVADNGLFHETAKAMRESSGHNG
jgi:hypothetical protein